MNNLVFNNTAKKLNATFYGVYENEVLPVAVDENGLFLFSPLSLISVTATDLDIRDLDSDTDSVTVVATDLDIRSLSGSRDSVAVSSMGFVEQSAGPTALPTNTLTRILVRDISPYGGNGYFIRNVSGASISVALQISPEENIDEYYISHSASQTLTSGNNLVAAVTIPMKYARLLVQTFGTGATIVAYYNGRA